jgi:CRP/FNR family transcriptional regulator, nitrogen fixation regulation protein
MPVVSKIEAGVQTRSGAAISRRTAPDGSPGPFEMMGALMPYERNEEIFGAGEPSEYLYKVVSGAVRTFTILDDGRRQVSAFYLPGDYFGLEIGNEHSSSCEAIANSKVLVFKRSAVLALANRDTSVARRLWDITSGELSRAQEHIVLLIKSAQERVGSFLLGLARQASSAAEIDLPMSRQDIADYLGLTIETVSRTLTQFEASGYIALPTSRHVVLRNHSALVRLNG